MGDEIILNIIDHKSFLQHQKHVKKMNGRQYIKTLPVIIFGDWTITGYQIDIFFISCL